MVDPGSVAGAGLTVDDLARRTNLPVRTIREYQTLRLLPPPDRRGRIGFYGERHLARLELIARLQQRGYSLAGIRDLLGAWEAGADLPALLGVDVGRAALDETPVRLTHAQLGRRLPGLKGATMRRASAVGLVQSDGPDHFLLRSPALLGLVADGVNAGVPLVDMLQLIGTLRDQLAAIADGIAAQIVERVWEPRARNGGAGKVEAMLRRGRILLLQGVASTLAHELGQALLRHAERATDADALRATIERLQVGAIADQAGNIKARGTP